MSVQYASPGWYPSPDNKALVRYWDGEMWTNSTRPADSSASTTGAIGWLDHFVQHSEVVAAELRDGEVIQLGYKATNTNTGRKQFVVVTDQRVFKLVCKYFRRSEIKSVESIAIDEIDTVGTAQTSGMTQGVITSGNRTMVIPYYGGRAADVVAWLRLQIDGDDDAVDVRTLPAPTGTVAGSSDGRPQSVGARPSAQLGVADEIRKLGELLNEGMLTEAEFAAQKQRLLGA